MGTGVGTGVGSGVGVGVGVGVGLGFLPVRVAGAGFWTAAFGVAVFWAATVWAEGAPLAEIPPRTCGVAPGAGCWPSADCFTPAKAAASKQTNATVMGRRFILCKPNLEPAPLFKMIAPNSTLTGENERTKKFCFFR